MLRASRANVEQLGVMEGYKRLVAPFDGIVTARNTDVGDLISAGSGAAIGAAAAGGHGVALGAAVGGAVGAMGGLITTPPPRSRY